MAKPWEILEDIWETARAVGFCGCLTQARISLRYRTLVAEVEPLRDGKDINLHEEERKTGA